MSKGSEIEAELKELAKEGAALVGQIKPESDEAYRKLLFEYQAWYSRALPAVKQIMPDRYEEFCELYMARKPRSTIRIDNYTISDVARGLNPDGGAGGVGGLQLAKILFHRQVQIVGAASGRLKSALRDITGMLEASLADDEISQARQLLRANQPRAAGVITGVILERHLKRLAIVHEVPTKRTNWSLSTLNEALKAASVYDIITFRKIQHLSDIRNLCAHSGDREPRREEVAALIDGLSEVIKTVS